MWAQLQKQRHGSTEWERYGRELATWLFGSVGLPMLEECRRDFLVDRVPRRIALVFRDRDYADWPWEAAYPQAMQPIGLDDSFVVVRRFASFTKTLVTSNASSARRSVILSGTTVVNANVPKLETGREIDAIRSVLAGFHSRDVNVDTVPDGDWEALESLVGNLPPTVFHFAGHGIGDGASLLFSEKKQSRSIDAQRLSLLLTRSAQPSRLVVLNACKSAAGPDVRFDPMGGVAQRLLENNVEVVIGHQAPIGDGSAKQFASELYKQLVDGAPSDLAAQAARRQMRLLGETATCEWAFVVLLARGNPTPIFDQVTTRKIADPDLLYFEVAFAGQRSDLRSAIAAGGSFVGVVHGPMGAGHHYVLERARKDVTTSDRLLMWQPIASMRWEVGGDETLNKQALLGTLAGAAKISSDGTEEELMNAIAEWIHRRSHDRTLVLEMENVCTASSKEEAEAIVALVKPVWRGLVERSRSTNAILLLPIGYPQGFWQWLRRRRTQATIKRLRSLDRTDSLRLVVTNELEPIPPSSIRKTLEHISVDDTRIDSFLERYKGSPNQFILEDLRSEIRKRSQ
ncbi:MAG: CHAT domain-containing protein [Kofleriaceae bacterium]